MNKSWFSIVKGIAMIILLTFFWLLIFAALDNNRSGNNYEPFSGAAIIFAIVSYIVILFIFQYNKVIHLKEEISSSFHAIEIKENHVHNLIVQLQEVTDKIVDHELKMSVKNTVSELFEEDKNSDHITSDGNDSQHSQTKRKMSVTSGETSYHENVSQVTDKVTKIVERVERDTKGTANQSLRDLIAEIKEAEVLVTNQRLYHNDMVSNYNRAIYMLPFSFLRSVLGHTEKNYI